MIRHFLTWLDYQLRPPRGLRPMVEAERAKRRAEVRRIRGAR